METYEFEMERAKIGKEMSACVDFILSDENASCNMPFEERQMAAVAFEEAFVNICSYAYGEGDGYVRVFIKKDGRSISVHLFDMGIPFDIANVEIKEAEPDQIGGHGIRLIREYTSVFYESIGGMNHLSMVVPKVDASVLATCRS